MERRKAARVRTQIPCSILVEDKPVAALVRNVSASGLGVDAPLELVGAGDEIEVTLRPPGRAPVDLVAMVWHARAVRRAGGGERFAQLGLVLSEASDDYARLVDALLPTGDHAELAAPAEGAPRLRFAVQIACPDSSRTRRVVVFAATAEQARELAHEAAGSGWSVVQVERSRG